MDLFFRHLGSGHPMIILHGLFGSSDNWMTISKQFADRHSVFIPDLRNHGLSFHDDEWSYDAMVEDLHHFILTHSLEKPIILGHSMGGKVAMNFAANYSDIPAKLIVVDMAPRYYPVRHGRILEGLNAVPVNEISSRTDADTILSRYVTEAPVRQFLLKNLSRNDRGTFNWKINLPVMTDKIDQVGREVLHGQYIGPTLFIEGKNSDYVTKDDEAHILQLFPFAEIIGIDGAGHWVHAEKPKEFTDIVNKFLSN